jgi:hypothetical protein
VLYPRQNKHLFGDTLKYLLEISDRKDKFKINTGSHLHMAFQVPYIYDYIMKLCRQQAEAIQNHENAKVPDIGQGEARHRKCKRLNLAAVRRTTVQVTRQPL